MMKKEVLEGLNNERTIRINNQNYTADPLDKAELGIFQAEYDLLFGLEDSVLKKMLDERLPHVFQAVRVMKKKMGAAFRGMYAVGGELGWGQIRPYHAGANAATWSKTYSGAGYVDWLGSAAVPRSVYKYHAMVVLAMDNQAESGIYTDEVLFNQNGSTWPVQDLRQLALADNKNLVPVQPLKTMYFMPNDTFFARALANAAGTDKPRLVGVSLGAGTYLSKETYTGNPPE